MTNYREVIIGQGSVYRAVLDQQVNSIVVYDMTNTEEIMRMSYQEWKDFTTPMYKEIVT